MLWFLTTVRDLAPGDLYWIDARVEDESGNMSSVLVSVYGLNPQLPEVRINEFVCEGTGRHVDWVELLVLGDGNLGGLTLYEGSPGIWDSRYVLSAMDVAAGTSSSSTSSRKCSLKRLTRPWTKGQAVATTVTTRRGTSG
jgi:hypothetical protein